MTKLRAAIVVAAVALAGLDTPARGAAGWQSDQDAKGFKLFGLPLVPDRSTGAATLRFVTPGAGYLKASAQDGTITASATIPYADITGGPSTSAITATTGDVVSAGPGSVPATIQANVVSNAKLRQGVGVSVIGVTGSSTANVADIAATGGSQFLGTNAAGTALSFTASIPLTSMGTTTAANVAALEALAGSGYRDGSRVYVQSLQREFVYHASNSLTVDHITVASATGAAGARWLSDAIPWLTYWMTTAWFVDPANSSAVASDQNTGTSSGAPLRSFAELGRRLYGAQLVSGTITVTLMSDTPQSDPLIIRGVSTTGFTFFSIIGTPTTVVSGRTISAVRMPGITANDHFEITDASGISGFVQNNLLHKTNGTQAWFWGYKDLGSNKLQISMPMTTGGGAATLANGDTYEVLDPPDFADLIIEPISSGGFVFYDVQKVRVFGATNVGVPAPGGPSVWDRCVMQGAGATIFGHGIDSVSLQNVMVPATAGGTNLLGRWGATGGLYAGNGTTTQVFFSEGYTLGGSNLPMTLGGASMVVTHDARFEKMQIMLYDWTGTQPGVGVTHRSTALITGLGGERNTGPLVGVDTFSQAVATDGFVSWNTAITTHATPYSVGANLFTASSLGVGTNLLATEAMGIIDYGASWGGDLSGKAIDPIVIALHETSGPTRLLLGAISSGQALIRSGSTIVGATLGTVTSVGATLPLTSTGGATPVIALNYDNSTITLNVGNGIQVAAQTGDVTKPAGSNVTTLATVGGGAGSCTYCSATFDTKGRQTAYSSGATPALAARVFTAGAGMTGGGDLSADRTFDVVAGDATIVVHADDVVAGVMQTANLANDAATNVKLANMATQTFKGRTTAGTGDPEDLTATQATAMLNLFTTSLKGLVPAGTGAAGTFLAPDGTWAVPAGSGGTITSVAGTAGRISSTGTTAITLDLIATAVTPASYTYGSFTVDAYGRLTAASSGATPAPVGATYITQTADATLTNEQALTSLSDGVMEKTAGGVVGTFVAGANRIATGSGTAGALTDSANLKFNGQTFGLGSLQEVQVFNASTSTTAFAGFRVGTDASYTNGFDFGMTGTNWSGGALGTNVGLIELAAGSSPMIVSNNGTGKISFTTTSSRIERMEILTGGDVVMTDNLTVDGLGPTNGLVKSVSGLLTLATTADYVPPARTLMATSPVRIDGGGSADFSANRTISLAMPNSNRVLAGNGPGTDFVASDEVRIDSTFTDSLMVSQDGAVIWRDLGGGSMIGATNYAEVAGTISSGVFTLKARKGGTGTVPAMKIDPGTATLTLAGAVSVPTSFQYTASTTTGDLLFAANTTGLVSYEHPSAIFTGGVVNVADGFGTDVNASTSPTDNILSISTSGSLDTIFSHPATDVDIQRQFNYYILGINPLDGWLITSVSAATSATSINYDSYGGNNTLARVVARIDSDSLTGCTSKTYAVTHNGTSSSASVTVNCGSSGLFDSGWQAVSSGSNDGWGLKVTTSGVVVAGTVSGSFTVLVR